MRYHSLILALVFASSAKAQDYSLYIQTSQTETGFEVADVQKITCEDGNIVITRKDGTKSQPVPLSEVRKMYFSTVPVAIRDPRRNPGDDDSDAPVFNLQGVRVTSSYKGIVIKNGKKTIQN